MIFLVIDNFNFGVILVKKVKTYILTILVKVNKMEMKNMIIILVAVN